MSALYNMPLIEPSSLPVSTSLIPCPKAPNLPSFVIKVRVPIPCESSLTHIPILYSLFPTHTGVTLTFISLPFLLIPRIISLLPYLLIKNVNCDFVLTSISFSEKYNHFLRLYFLPDSLHYRLNLSLFQFL